MATNVSRLAGRAASECRTMRWCLTRARCAAVTRSSRSGPKTGSDLRRGARRSFWARSYRSSWPLLVDDHAPLLVLSIAHDVDQVLVAAPVGCLRGAAP